MKINVPLRRKDAEIEASPCNAEKIIELSADLFNHFSENMLNDYDFIIENIDCMYQDINGVNHCLLVLGEGRDDGILVESEGSIRPLFCICSQCPSAMESESDIRAGSAGFLQPNAGGNE